MRPRTTLFVGSFFFSVSSTATIYVLFPFLSGIVSPVAAGAFIAAGALVSSVLFFYLPVIVARFGAQKLAVFFGFAEMIALLLLAAYPGVVAGVALAVLAVSLPPFIYYQLDLLLEASTDGVGVTGRTRSLFLTMWNIGALTAPLLLGALLADGSDYGRIFLAGAAALVPFVTLLSVRSLPKGRAPSTRNTLDTLACMRSNKDLTAVTVGHLLLYCFYIWAPLYIPAYLHGALGIPWSELGWVLFAMLLPYVLIPYPAGVIADRYIGDKEMMFAGFLIAGGALAAVGTISASTPLWLMVAILIATRVGAALVESTTEGHFFRRVSEGDVNSISVFRGIWPIGNVIAPLLGSAILFFGNYQLLFLLTGGCIAIVGLIATVYVKDFNPRAYNGPANALRSLPVPMPGAPAAPAPAVLSPEAEEGSNASRFS